MNYPIKVMPYNPQWQAMFADEAKLIQQALGDNCVVIHHIGSTSVPGLDAKPIIDILPVVRDIQSVEHAVKAMESLGYEFKGEHGIAFRRFFQKGNDFRPCNVHIFQENDPEISRYLKFRDWMRTHPEDAGAYAALKRELAAHSENMLQYCNGKDAFVASIDVKTGYDGWRIVQALTNREWAAVRKLGGEEPIVGKDHVHFVFYKKSEIIGYLHIQLFSEHQAIIKNLIIDSNYSNMGFEKQLRTLGERWLLHQGFNISSMNLSQ